jgi:inner membrane protein
MRWINHILIAGSLCAVIAPTHLAPVILGATAPDWLEWLAKRGGRPLKHRGPTHILTHWLISAVATTFLFDLYGILSAFAWGGLSHILTDAMTVSGVPFSPYSDRRFHLFGGRFRTGDPVEYAISAAVVLTCILLTKLIGDTGFIPFFYDWANLYQQGIIDAIEWKQNRFRLL